MFAQKLRTCWPPPLSEKTAMSVLLEAGLDLSPVITGRYGYRDFEADFADAASGRGGKVILDWTA